MSDPRDILSTQTVGPGAQSPVPSGPEVVEDSGSQALAEALRSSFLIVKVLMVGVVIYFFCSGIFTVGPQEKAVILRFGRPVGQGENALLGPGLHFAFPEPIDEIVRIPVGQVQVVNSTIGWYATTPLQRAAKNEPPPGPSLDPAKDGYVLTGDRNILHVEGALRYRIQEPGLEFTFNFKEASNLVQNAFNNALVYATARYPVDGILTEDATGYRELVRRRLDQLVEQQKLNIVVDQIELEAIAPRQLAANFRAVTEAGIQSKKTILEANQYANQTVSRAKAEKEGRIAAAQSERTRLVDFVAAEANRFKGLLKAYRTNPELLMEEQKTTVMKRVLNTVQDKWVLPKEAGGKPAELRLQLNREPPKPKASAPASTDKHGH